MDNRGLIIFGLVLVGIFAVLFYTSTGKDSTGQAINTLAQATADAGTDAVQQQKFGTLDVYSTPVGANIYVNGVYKGTTPKSIALKAGIYTVKMTKAGYLPYSTKVTIYTLQTTTVSANLTSNATPSPSVMPSPSPVLTPSPIVNVTPSPSPIVNVTPSPSPNATISPTPSINATPSPSPNATISPTPSINASPSPTPLPANGTLIAYSNPSVAGAYIDKAGNPWPYPFYGFTTYQTQLAPGNYYIELRKSGYDSYFGTFTITSGGYAYVSANLTISNQTNQSNFSSSPEVAQFNWGAY